MSKQVATTSPTAMQYAAWKAHRTMASNRLARFTALLSAEERADLQSKITHYDGLLNGAPTSGPSKVQREAAAKTALQEGLNKDAAELRKALTKKIQPATADLVARRARLHGAIKAHALKKFVKDIEAAAPGKLADAPVEDWWAAGLTVEQALQRCLEFGAKVPETDASVTAKRGRPSKAAKAARSR